MQEEGDNFKLSGTYEYGIKLAVNLLNPTSTSTIEYDTTYFKDNMFNITDSLSLYSVLGQTLNL